MRRCIYFGHRGFPKLCQGREALPKSPLQLYKICNKIFEKIELRFWWVPEGLTNKTQFSEKWQNWILGGAALKYPPPSLKVFCLITIQNMIFKAILRWTIPFIKGTCCMAKVTMKKTIPTITPTWEESTCYWWSQSKPMIKLVPI